MSKLRSFLLSSLGILYSVLSTAPSALAQSPVVWTGRCVGTGASSDVATIQGFECLFYNILQFVIFAAGMVFLFVFISGGFKYMTSAGDEKRIDAAKSALTSSVLGLVGVIVSWLILKFIQQFTGISITQLIIPG